MTGKVITAFISVGTSAGLLVALSGCGPAKDTTQIQIPVQEAPASKPKPQKKPPAPNCTPGYKPCLLPRADYNCRDIKGSVLVTGSDPYLLDSDHDGVGCDR